VQNMFLQDQGKVKGRFSLVVNELHVLSENSLNNCESMEDG
jgi:hypothetical protein